MQFPIVFQIPPKFNKNSPTFRNKQFCSFIIWCIARGRRRCKKLTQLANAMLTRKIFGTLTTLQMKFLFSKIQVKMLGTAGNIKVSLFCFITHCDKINDGVHFSTGR